METRRDFVIKSVATLLSASLGNPAFLLGSECSEPSVTILIYLRGGSDGLDMFQPVDSQQNSELLGFLRNGRANDSQSQQFTRSALLLPPSLSNQSRFCSAEVIPISSSSQLGFHPAWERLRNVQTVNNNLKPQRISCDQVDQGLFLDDHLIFRVMKGVGMLHFYLDPPSVPLHSIRINKSHFDTQAMSLLASISASTGVKGFLGRAAYFGESCTGNESLQNRMKLIGFGNFTNAELGGDSCRDILRISGSFRDFNVPSVTTHLGFPDSGCRNYRETLNPSIMTSGAMAEDLRSLIRDLRSHSDGELATLVRRAYEVASQVDSTLQSLEGMDILRIGSENDDAIFERFGRGEYYFENGQWKKRIVTKERISGMFMNVCRFILSENQHIRNVNKTIAMSIGGFDTHSNQLTDLPKLISSLAGGLHGLFYTVRKKRPCLFKKFAVYVMSEFGRTIRANTGMSTDHGWGSVLMAIFGSYNPIPRNQRLDRELGPQFILTSSASERDNIRRMNSADYARELSHVHVDIDPMHLYPKISMHSALALILSKSLNVPAGNLQQFFNEIMLPEFYKKNYIRYSDEMRLWTEFLDGIPDWA